MSEGYYFLKSATAIDVVFAVVDEDDITLRWFNPQ